MGANCLPRLEINDQSLILDQAEQQRWDLLSSSADSLGKSADVADEAPSGVSKVGLKRQHTVYTMTQQNKRSRLGHYSKGSEKEAGSSMTGGFASKAGSISQSVMRGYSQVQAIHSNNN